MNMRKTQLWEELYSCYEGIDSEVDMLQDLMSLINQKSIFFSDLESSTVVYNLAHKAHECKLGQVSTSKAEHPPLLESECSFGGESNVIECSITRQDEDGGSGKLPPSSDNGGNTDNYTWMQTLDDVSLVIKVPETIKGKQIHVQYKTNHLKVEILNQVHIDGDLCKKVCVEDCTWTLQKESNKDNFKTLSIYLPKSDKLQWWNSVIVGDPIIDISKIEPESSKLSDLDGETRQTVEKMMFDQRQKNMNKPTSDEMNKEQMLKKFMDSHPEMDFSQAKIM